MSVTDSRKRSRRIPTLATGHYVGNPRYGVATRYGPSQAERIEALERCVAFLLAEYELDHDHRDEPAPADWSYQ